MSRSASMPSLGHAHARVVEPQGRIGDLVLKRKPPAFAATLTPLQSLPYSAKDQKAMTTSTFTPWVLPRRAPHSCMVLHPEIAPENEWLRLRSPMVTRQQRRAEMQMTFPLTGVPAEAASSTASDGFAGAHGRREGRTRPATTGTLAHAPPAARQAPAAQAKLARPKLSAKKSSSSLLPCAVEKPAPSALPPILDLPFDVHGNVLAEVLATSGVALPRVSYLRQLSKRGMRLPRYQDLPTDPPQQYRDLRASDVVRGEEIRRQLSNNQLYAVSHAWLTFEHPDPTGIRLEEIVEELIACGAKACDLVFIDFCSLPQVDRLDPDWRRAAKSGETLPAGHPALRTEQEERDFESAVSQIDAVFASSASKVIVLSDVDDLDEVDPMYTENKRLYRQRGWCCFEFAVASLFDRIVSPVPKEMANFRPLSFPDLVQEGKASFTQRGDASRALQIFQRTYHAGKVGDIVAAIAHGRADRCRDGICAALAARKAGVRQTVVRALGDHACAGYMEELVLMLEDADAAVRAEACSAVSRMGFGAEHARELAALLDDSHYQVRAAACGAVADMGGDAANHREAVAACLSDDSWEVREAAMLALGRMGDALSIHKGTVAGCLKDPIPITRVAALTSFWRMDNAEATKHANEVFDIAKDDKFYFVRDAALATLEKMGMDAMVKELRDESSDEDEDEDGEGHADAHHAEGH